MSLLQGLLFWVRTSIRFLSPFLLLLLSFCFPHAFFFVFSYPFFFAHLFLSSFSRSLLYNSFIVINPHSNSSSCCCFSTGTLQGDKCSRTQLIVVVVGRHHKTFEAHNHFIFFSFFTCPCLSFLGLSINIGGFNGLE